MKKNIFITTCILLVLSVKLFSQSNLTWVINDKYENGYFKNKVEIKSGFSGFANAAEATTFFNKLKGNPEIVSVEQLGKDAKGNYLTSIKVKEPRNGNFYLTTFNKLGVNNVDFGGD